MDPLLVVVPLSSLACWEAECQKAFPDEAGRVFLFQGSNAERTNLRNTFEHMISQTERLGTIVVVTTYEVAMRDHTHLLKFRWGCMVVDQGSILKALPHQFIERCNRLSVRRVLLTNAPLPDDDVNYTLALLTFVASSAVCDPVLHSKLVYSEVEYGKWSQQRSCMHAPLGWIIF
jgi:hypothetical protein